MIKRRDKIQKFENEMIRRERVDVMKNFRLVNSMYEQAVSLGIFPQKDALEGLEIDIKIAKVVNSVSKAP